MMYFTIFLFQIRFCIFWAEKIVSRGEAKKVLMETEEIKVGDYVECMDNYPPVTIGKTGKVVVISDSQYGIEWKDISGGHDCSGKCKYGLGWYVTRGFIKKVSSPKEEKKIEDLTGRWLKCLTYNNFHSSIKIGDYFKISKGTSKELETESCIDTEQYFSFSTGRIKRGEFELMPVGFIPPPLESKTMNTYGLSVGDVLSYKVLNGWDKQGKNWNFPSSNDGEWTSRKGSWSSDRSIVSFKEVKGIVGVHLSGCSEALYIRRS